MIMVIFRMNWNKSVTKTPQSPPMNVYMPVNGTNTSTQISSAVCAGSRSEEHTSELQSPDHLVCRLLLEKKKRVQLREYTADCHPIRRAVRDSPLAQEIS